MSTRCLIGMVMVVVCLGASALAADEGPTQVQNWAAPQYWTPPAAAPPPNQLEAAVGGAAEKAGVSIESLPSSPLPFVAVTPCRLVDTRAAYLKDPHTPARGSFIDAETRAYDFSASTDCPGLPSNVGAWSLNFQLNTSLASASYIAAYPTGTTYTVGSFSTVLGYSGKWIMNAAIIPGGTAGQISVYSSKAADLIIEVNGYYSGSVGLTLPYTGSAASAVGTDIFSVTNSGSGRAMHAIASGDTALWAQSTSGIGVDGRSSTNTAVFGQSGSGMGVYGVNGGSSNYGYLGGTLYGVYGYAGSGTAGYFSGYQGIQAYGATYGVYATASVPSSGTAGYFSGWDGVHAFGTNYGGYFMATGAGEGIYATATGLAGYFTGFNGIKAYGSIPMSGTAGYFSGFTGVAAYGSSGGWAVYASNTASGIYSGLGAMLFR